MWFKHVKNIYTTQNSSVITKICWVESIMLEIFDAKLIDFRSRLNLDKEKKRLNTDLVRKKKGKIYTYKSWGSGQWLWLSKITGQAKSCLRSSMQSWLITRPIFWTQAARAGAVTSPFTIPSTPLYDKGALGCQPVTRGIGGWGGYPNP